MITLLAKWLIKDKPDGDKPRVRYAYGVLASTVGIGLNALLFIGKLVVGLMAGSIAITADAFNNLSDAGSSVVALLGFSLARQKPDAEHPFGHGRIEYVAGLVVSAVIILMGAELFQSSVDRIMKPQPIVWGTLTAVILIVSILIKLYMAWYNRRIGKAIASPVMSASAIDSLSDAISTGVVLLATFIGHMINVYLDGWCGLLVAAVVLYAGYQTARDAISPLLGQPPDPAFVEHIKQIVGKYPEIIGIHDLIVHDYGPGRRMISFHGEVPAKGDILVLHDSIDNLEKELQDELGCQAVIHMDPVITDDVVLNQTKERVAEVVKGLDERVTIHDFRMVTGPTHKNLIFDVAIPYDIKLSEQEIQQRISHMVHALNPKFYAVVQIDRNYAEVK
jgi:cation diffusion facilitator family transporter